MCQNSNRWLEKLAGRRIWRSWAARTTWSGSSSCERRPASVGPRRVDELFARRTELVKSLVSWELQREELALPRPRTHDRVSVRTDWNHWGISEAMNVRSPPWN